MVPSRYILAPLGVFFVIKTLGDEWYVVMKAYKLTVFDILRDFFVLPYIACPRYPYIIVYRLYDRDLPQSFQEPGSIENTTHTLLLQSQAQVHGKLNYAHRLHF